jgi:hypothetical protein
VARETPAFYSLNRGECSLLALSRIDIEHLRLAAQSQVNWLPRVLGPMSLRPGSQFIGEILGDKPAKLLPFVAGFNDTALLELTDGFMRVWRDDALIEREAVGTVIPDFPGWTTVNSGTAVTTASAGALTFANMNANATANAVVQVAVAPADVNVEHALRFTVANGPVSFSIGSAPSLDDVFARQTLDTGLYSMAFTPGFTSFYVTFNAVRLANNANTTSQSIPTWAQQTKVTGISIESAGVLTLPVPWGADEIGTPGIQPSTIRIDQSADVIFCAARGKPQYQINRYSPTSWAIVNYRSVKGPMSASPSNASINLAPGAYSGNTTLQSSANLFSPNDVGTLFRIFHSGQTVVETLSFPTTYTDAIEVTGVSYVSTIDGGGNVVNTATTDRNFTITTTGSWTGNLVLQRSFTSATAGFTDYKTFTSNQTGLVVTDGLNNEIVWYRLGFEDGGLTSGQVIITLKYTGGGNYGVCHVLSYISATLVNVEVLVPFWGIVGTSDWLQSEWSASSGYPTSVALHDGRAWWAGADKWWGSVSDDYNNIDYDAAGEAAPIDRSIGKGPIANINWLVSVDHLLGGADTSIITALSDAIESPLTPTNFTLRRSVTNGSFPLQACPVDQRVIYIDQSGRRVFALVYDIRLYNYTPSDLTRLNPDIGLPGFNDFAVQRQPDTRVNLVRNDGILVSLIYDADDDVMAFWKAQTKGTFEAIAVLPGAREDQVYVVVNRTIGGTTKRYLEKFARIDECQGDAINKLADSHLVYEGTAANVLQGFKHIAGETVVIWGQTAAGVIGDLGTATVTVDGEVTIPGGVQVTAAVIGLYYASEFISAKLEYAARTGSAMNKTKRIDHIGFSLVNTHAQGVRYGAWTANDSQNQVDGVFSVPPVLDPMPQTEYSEAVDPNKIWQQYDAQQIEFPCDDDTDVRLYIQAAAPRPATVCGITFAMETAE